MTFYRVCEDGTVRWFTAEDAKYGFFAVITAEELNKRIRYLLDNCEAIPMELGDNQDIEFDGDGNCIVVDENFDDGSGFPAAG